LKQQQLIKSFFGDDDNSDEDDNSSTSVYLDSDSDDSSLDEASKAVKNCNEYSKRIDELDVSNNAHTIFYDDNNDEEDTKFLSSISSSSLSTTTNIEIIQQSCLYHLIRMNAGNIQPYPRK
jgi:hypothetical protein